MIIAISDLHFGYSGSDVEAINHFICNYVKQKLRKKDHFVLLGDIFDFWRKTNAEILYENKEYLRNILDLKTNIHYIIGNHDLFMRNIIKRFENHNIDFQMRLRLKENHKKYFFTHGYELDVLANYEPVTIEEYEKISMDLCRTTTFFGNIFSRLWGIYRVIQRPPDKRFSVWKDGFNIKKSKHVDNVKKLACSSVRDFFLGLEEDETLIFGHTHKPFMEKNAVNAGSWILDDSKYHNFVEISNGSLALKEYVF